jgi:hypothetical protein
MDANVARGLIAEGEGQRIEFKKGFAEANEIIISLCALAHAEGGTVLVGVDDDQSIVGVQLGRNTLETFASSLKANTEPLIAPSIDSLQLDGETIVAVTIPTARPSELFHAYGRAYIRVGKTNQVMPTEMQRSRLRADPRPEEHDVPRFEAMQRAVSRLESTFTPEWAVRQVSGDYVANLEWRFRGPRFVMAWLPASGANLDRMELSATFDLTRPTVADNFVADDQLGLEFRFFWRGHWRHELHRYSITRVQHPGKVLWDVGSEVIPPIYFTGGGAPASDSSTSAAVRSTQGNDVTRRYDAFICHASEDKDAFVRAIATELRKHIKVWYDEFSLSVGDSLRRSIDKGIAESRYGIVVLSPSFFKKQWPQRELDGLSTLEVAGHSVILPVWFEVDHKNVAQYSPMLADKVAVRAATGVPQVVAELLRVILGSDRMREVSPALSFAASHSSAPAASMSIDQMCSDVENRWMQRMAEAGQEADDLRYDLGHWSAAYRLEPAPEPIPLAQLLDALRRAEGSETGWPVWMVPTIPGLEPYAYDGSLECWLAARKDPVFHDSAHGDFWRVSPNGCFYLLRGYDEDVPGRDPKEITQGKMFDLTIPAWRVGEVLLHASRMSTILSSTVTTAELRFRWTGLRNRQLISWANKKRFLLGGHTCHQPTVVVRRVVDTIQIRDRLAEYVEGVTQPLYDAFNLFVSTSAMVSEEVGELTRNGKRIPGMR